VESVASIIPNNAKMYSHRPYFMLLSYYNCSHFQSTITISIIRGTQTRHRLTCLLHGVNSGLFACGCPAVPIMQLPSSAPRRTDTPIRPAHHFGQTDIFMYNIHLMLSPWLHVKRLILKVLWLNQRGLCASPQAPNTTKAPFGFIEF
jgi:hypothetical protein